MVGGGGGNKNCHHRGDKRLVHDQTLGIILPPCSFGAGHCRAKRSREGASLDFLKVILAGAPPPIDLHLEVEDLVDAPRGVTPSLPRRGIVLLAVYE